MRESERRKSEQGFNLLELLTAMAVFTLSATLVVPAFLSLSAGLRVDLAAREVVSAMARARSLAVRRSENVAVRFRVGAGVTSFGLYRDGDGDGVLNRDIDAGVDPEVEPVRPLEHVGRDVRIGLPPEPVRDPSDPGSLLTNTGDPVRFNNSDLASFSPLGGSTPGSVYLTDGRRRLAAVRVTGRTGKILVIRYDFENGIWR